MSNILSEKVDLHAHYLPKTYKKFLISQGDLTPDGFPTPVWTIKKQLENMEALNIKYAILSISSPCMNVGDDDKAKKLTRKVNEEGAEIVSKYPDKFGFIATLPMPNVEFSIEEAKHAISNLGALGVGVTTNSLGVYLGDERLDGLMEELDDMKCTVLIHPTTPSAVPKNVNENLPIPAMEFFFDTTRTIANMIQKDIFNRFPNIKWIVPHAGAFLPVLADRLQAFEPVMKLIERKEIDVMRDLRNLYYDVAGFSVPKQLELLLKTTSIDNLVYGSDSPYTPISTCKDQAEALEETTILSDEDRHKIFIKNYKKLFSIDFL